MLFTINDELSNKYSKIKVVGDLHGDLDSFHAIRKYFNKDNDILIFLGDYADRGDSGLEIIEELFRWQKEGHENIILLKGNHELYSPGGVPGFRPCDLIDEAVLKRGSWESFFENTMHPFLSRLYHAAILPGEILFVHAGVSSELTQIENLENPDKALERNLLWSDPTEEDITERFNATRGEGVVFGNKLTAEICRKLGVKKIIRSHQPLLADQEPSIMHEGRLITTQTTSSYHGKPYLLEIPVDMPGEWKKTEL